MAKFELNRRSSDSRRCGSTLANVGAGNLSIPEQEMHTSGFWLHFPQKPSSLALPGSHAHREAERDQRTRERPCAPIASLLLMCDPRDLGVAVTEDIGSGLKAYRADLFLYDNYPGGIGQSAPLFQLRRKLLEGASSLLAGCPCDSGCPSCVGPVGEVGERGKMTAARILAELL